MINKCSQTSCVIVRKESHRYNLIASIVLRSLTFYHQTSTMKPLLLALAIPVLIAGCRSNEKTTNAAGTASSAMTADSIHAAPLPDGAKRVVVETRAPDGTTTITSTTTQEAEAAAEPKKKSVARTSEASAASAPTAAEKKKKGWSTRAKGAAIGGAAGAATGAIISKNKAGGAIIVGAVGAGGGYIIGNEIDRNKKKP